MKEPESNLKAASKAHFLPRVPCISLRAGALAMLPGYTDLSYWVRSGQALALVSSR